MLVQFSRGKKKKKKGGGKLVDNNPSHRHPHELHHQEENVTRFQQQGRMMFLCTVRCCIPLQKATSASQMLMLVYTKTIEVLKR